MNIPKMIMFVLCVALAPLILFIGIGLMLIDPHGDHGEIVIYALIGMVVWVGMPYLIGGVELVTAITLAATRLLVDGIYFINQTTAGWFGIVLP